MRSRTSSSSSNALLLAHVPGAEQKRRRRSLYFFGMISPQRDGWRKCAQSLSCEGSLVTHLGEMKREMFPDEKSESLRGLFEDGDEYRTNDRFLFTQY